MAVWLEVEVFFLWIPGTEGFVTCFAFVPSLQLYPGALADERAQVRVGGGRRQRCEGSLKQLAFYVATIPRHR